MENKYRCSKCKDTGWIQTDKGWQYKNESGEIVKNQWLFDVFYQFLSIFISLSIDFIERRPAPERIL